MPKSPVPQNVTWTSLPVTSVTFAGHQGKAGNLTHTSEPFVRDGGDDMPDAALRPVAGKVLGEANLGAVWVLLMLQMHARCWFRHRRAERVPKGHHSGSAVVEMILAALLTARPPPLLLTMLVPGDPPPISIDPFRASRAAGLPWWLPQNLQDGLPDDWPALKEQRASRAASFPRWLSQTEQDGLPDDRPADMEVSQSKARALGHPLSMLRRAIFSTSEDGIFRTRLETQPNDQDDPGSAASDTSSAAR